MLTISKGGDSKAAFSKLTWTQHPFFTRYLTGPEFWKHTLENTALGIKSWASRLSGCPASSQAGPSALATLPVYPHPNVSFQNFSLSFLSFLMPLPATNRSSFWPTKPHLYETLPSSLRGASHCTFTDPGTCPDSCIFKSISTVHLHASFLSKNYGAHTNTDQASFSGT